MTSLSLISYCLIPAGRGLGSALQILSGAALSPRLSIFFLEDVTNFVMHSISSTTDMISWRKYSEFSIPNSWHKLATLLLCTPWVDSYSLCNDLPLN